MLTPLIRRNKYLKNAHFVFCVARYFKKSQFFLVVISYQILKRMVPKENRKSGTVYQVTNKCIAVLSITKDSTVNIGEGFTKFANVSRMSNALVYFHSNSNTMYPLATAKNKSVYCRPVYSDNFLNSAVSLQTSRCSSVAAF